MAISFGSINTGLPKDIVQQIMAAERAPLQKLEARKGKIEEKKALVNELATLMDGIRSHIRTNGDRRSFTELRAITNDELIDVTLDKAIAKPGEYRFQVNRLAQKSSAMTSGFAHPDKSYIGVGYLRYFLPSGESRDLYVDSDHASLRGVAKLINNDPTNGMNANVINDGSGEKNPWRLVISLNNTGDDHLAEFPYFYFVDGEDDFYLDFQREAHDASISLDGFEIELPSNQNSELIPGVNLNLKKASPNEEFSIKIIQDYEAIQEKIEVSIEKINDVLKFIIDQNNLDEKTDTSRTLGGDITLQTLESRIRTAVFTPVMTSRGPKRLGDIGVTFQKDGLLKVDPKFLEGKLTANFTMVTELLLGSIDNERNITKGFFSNIKAITDGAVGRPFGILPIRKQGLESNIKQINQQIENRQRNLDQKEDVLKQKFARLEGVIAKLKGQSAGLSALAGNANPVTQLG